jgi:hypothetical protein
VTIKYGRQCFKFAKKVNKSINKCRHNQDYCKINYPFYSVQTTRDNDERNSTQVPLLTLPPSESEDLDDASSNSEHIVPLIGIQDILM